MIGFILQTNVPDAQFWVLSHPIPDKKGNNYNWRAWSQQEKINNMWSYDIQFVYIVYIKKMKNVKIIQLFGNKASSLAMLSMSLAQLSPSLFFIAWYQL